MISCLKGCTCIINAFYGNSPFISCYLQRNSKSIIQSGIFWQNELLLHDDIKSNWNKTVSNKGHIRVGVVSWSFTHWSLWSLNCPLFWAVPVNKSVAYFSTIVQKPWTAMNSNILFPPFSRFMSIPWENKVSKSQENDYLSKTTLVILR